MSNFTLKAAFLSFILAACFDVSAIQINGLNFATNSYDGTAELVAPYDNNPYSGDIVIPSTIVVDDTEYTVTSIGYRAFSRAAGLTSVVIPNTITKIGDSAFDSCTGLTSPQIGNSIVYIGKGAFNNCTSIEEIFLPATVATIGSEAFYGCTALRTLSVAAENQAYATLDGILYNKDFHTLIFCPAGKTSADNISESLEVIGSSAFANSAIKSITLPQSLTTIEYTAFEKCTELESIVIPDNVTFIDMYAFKCRTSTYQQYSLIRGM